MSSSARRQEINLRREALVVSSNAYRFHIKRDFEQLRRRVDNAATMLQLVNSLRSKIGVIGGIAALLTVRSRGAVFSWIRRGWIVWQLVRRYRRG